MFVNIRRIKVTQLNKITGCATVMLLTALLAGPAVAKASSSDGVVATVNGDKILEKDVAAAMKELSVSDADAERAFPAIVDQMINEKLLDSETASAKIEESDAYKTRMKAVREQLIKQLYLETFLKDKITDKKVKAEYEKFKKENAGKEEVHARHILLKTEAEAKRVIKDLDAGKKFEDLAAQRSSGPTAKTGGDLGYFTKEDMIAEFSAVAFKLKPGSYSKEPVKSQFGWHVIKVEDKRARKVPALKEVEMAIRNKMGQEAVHQLVMDLRAKADIKLFDKDGKPVEETKKN